MRDQLRRVAFSLSLLSFLMGGSLRAEEYHPFAIQGDNAGSKDISRLTCGNYIEIVKTKQRALLDITIWLHGFTAGMTHYNFPFDDKFVTTSARVVLLGCKNAGTPLADAFVAGSKLVSGEK